jgi:DNA processing protein
VVSGGARGIDALAHSVSLRCHASTVVVLGTGIDRVYPPEHGDLFDAVLASSGTLVTSFLPGTGPHKGNFPIRNRIIAGLSRAVLVVSAQARSGTSITAAYARDEGRDVWAVPGDPEDLYAAGTNSLIRSGAALIASADDIYKELGVVKKDLSSQSGERVWSDLEKVLLVGPLDDEGLAIKLSYSLEQVETELLELMINGRICRNYAGLWEIID